MTPIDAIARVDVNCGQGTKRIKSCALEFLLHCPRTLCGQEEVFHVVRDSSHVHVFIFLREVAKDHIVERNAVCRGLIDKLPVHIKRHLVIEYEAFREGLCSTLGSTETCRHNTIMAPHERLVFVTCPLLGLSNKSAMIDHCEYGDTAAAHEQ